MYMQIKLTACLNDTFPVHVIYPINHFCHILNHVTLSLAAFVLVG